MRGGFRLLTALAELTDDPAKAVQYLRLRDNLCPKGLRGTTQSYAEEAGAARLLPARLTAEDEKLLASIPLPDGHLRDVVKAWTGAALDLETLEDRKIVLARQIEESTAIRPVDTLQARYRWIRAANGLKANLELSEADPATLQAILKPLHDAAKKAERSRAARARGGAPAEKPASGAADEASGEAHSVTAGDEA